MEEGTMRCSTLRTQIDDHADGLLPARQAELVRDHLDACAECRDLAFAAKAASVSLARWGDLDPPADAFAKILGRIDRVPAESLVRRASPPSIWRRYAMPVGLAAAAALVAAVAMSQVLPRDAPLTTLSSDEYSVARGGLLPGEFYVASDPDDPALRRTRGPIRYVGNPPPRTGFDAQPPIVPVRYEDFPTVR